MSENLDQWTVAQRLDNVADYSSSEGRQHTTLSKLQSDQRELRPSKRMLRLILSMLVNQAEQIVEEEHTGFRSHRSTAEQIFSLRHLDRQKKLYHNVTDFKKAFDLVWHGGLWRV